ncbi:uncharacterized protein TM35_000052760 [Trypanosoma theileri]|uniref:Uncharacterized protein n=1 Tax=Trypanosoma theileri TaxID=67003 RepID=A0A1X0P5H6_9TRYP|nr:uncharacterized protein TM35_000052760 [Trypanosoma theileri]ORC91680.1 hypothetical protein TM35_000052760 [Trypanosoma theileri]
MGNANCGRTVSDSVSVSVEDNTTNNTNNNIIISSNNTSSTETRINPPPNDGYQGLEGLPSGMEKERGCSEKIAKRRASISPKDDPWLLFPKRGFVGKNTQNSPSTLSSYCVSLPTLSTSISSYPSRVIATSSYFTSTSSYPTSSFSSLSSLASSSHKKRIVKTTGSQKSYTAGTRNGLCSLPNISNNTGQCTLHRNQIHSNVSPTTTVSPTDSAAVAVPPALPGAAVESRRQLFFNDLPDFKNQSVNGRRKESDAIIRTDAGSASNDMNSTPTHRPSSVVFSSNVEVLRVDGSTVNRNLIENNLYRESLAQRCKITSEEYSP